MRSFTYSHNIYINLSDKILIKYLPLSEKVSTKYHRGRNY